MIGIGLDTAARRRGDAGRRPRRRPRPIAAEFLEERRLLSRIVWVDEGSTTGRNKADSDGFGAIYGANAPTARRIVEQAISDWSRVIADFNYTNVGKRDYAPYPNTIQLTIRANKLGGANLGLTRIFGTDRSGRDAVGNRNVVGLFKDELFGKPFESGVTLDDDGGGRGWYFDPDPADSSEFPQVVTPSHATGDIGGRYDFYSSALRLIGKAVGLADDSDKLADDSLKLGYVVRSRLGTKVFPFDPRTGATNLLYRKGFTDPRTGTPNTTFSTSEGQGGLYPGPLTAALNPSGSPNYVVLPNDLMTADPQPNTRDRISDIDAALLRYGYDIGPPLTVRNPSDLGMSVLTSLDPYTGLLRVSGDPTVAANQIDIAQDSNSIYVTINGRQTPYPAANVRSIAVTETGDDHVFLATTRSANVVGQGIGTLVVGLPATGNASVLDRAILMTDGGGSVLSAIGYSGLARVEVDGTVGQGTVLVSSTAATTPLSVVNVARMALGPNLDSILGPVDISGVVNDLTIDDSALRSARAAALFRTAVTGLSPAPITFSGANLSTFRLLTPTAASTLIVADTPENSRGDLLSQVTMGPFNDLALVQGTTGSLLLDAGGGPNTISVDYSKLGGTAFVAGATSSTSLFAEANIPGVLASMGTYQSSGVGYALAAGHAPLIYSIPALSSLTVRLAPSPLGSLGAFLSVDDSATGLAGFATYILLGDPADVVDVAKSSGPLAIVGTGGDGYQVRAGGQQARSLAGFNGQFTVVDAGLDLLDQNAAKAQVVGVAADRLTINGASVLNLSNVTRLRYNGANLANAYNIEGTPGNDLTVDGGTAADTFNVTPSSRTLDGLGQVVVNGGGGGDRLIVDDSKAEAGSVYGITSGPLLGLPNAAIGRGTAKVYGFSLASVSLAGSNLAALYGITSEVNGIPFSLHAGGGGDRFVVQTADDKGPLTLDAGGGANTLDYSAAKLQIRTPAAPGAPAAPGGAAPLPSGLVAWYKAENNVLDSKGNHNGMPTDLTFGPGEVGQAFQLGTTSAVNVPNSPDLNPKNLTVEAWVKPGANSTNQSHYIVSKSANEYAIGLIQDTLYFQIGTGNGAAVDATTTVPGDWVGQWHHVAGTFDGSTVRLYLDGKLVASQASGAPINYADASDGLFRIGRGVETFGGSNFSGSIDELSLYNRALTDAEVNSIFAAGKNGKSAAPATPVPHAPGVEVNLKAGTATGFAGGIAKIQGVIGTSTSDILVGDGGAVLDGGGGRDLLIAGKSAGQLTSRGDSILIGGTTAYDTDIASLDAVLAVWDVTDATYDDRANTLINGLLATGKVAGNGQANTLTGGAGKNLFFHSALDSTDRRSDEREVLLG